MLLFAHGIVGRADLPLPQTLFWAAAALVLVVSFIALALGWAKPRLVEMRGNVLFGFPRAGEVLLGLIGTLIFLFAIYAGLNPANIDTAMAIIREELDAMRQGNITEEEFTRAREQLKGGYILGLDGVSSRMSDMGKSLLLNDAIRTEDEVLAKINAIEPRDVAAVAQYIFDARYSAASAVGKLPGRRNMETILLG